MVKYFICSDVHSFFTELQKALNNAGFDIDNPEHIFVSLGDFYDRGKESLKCLQWVNSLPDNRKILIKGNHCDLIEAAMKRGYFLNHDLHNGTIQTAYDLCTRPDAYFLGHEDILKDLKYNKEFKKYLKSLVDYAIIDGFVFVHSWIPLTCKKKGFYHEEYSYNPQWKTASKKEWETARWGNPFDMVENGWLPDEHIVFGHWNTSYAWSKYENKPEWGEGADFSIYYGDRFTAIDGCTVYSKRVNILVIEDGKIIN